MREFNLNKIIEEASFKNESPDNNCFGELKY